MMPGKPDAYLLPRDDNESRRLNRQHRLWTRTLNYLIHPAIELSIPSNVRIADVATGTGVWAIATARTLPETVQFIGFDISASQFPNLDSVPKNLSFETQNLLKPFPRHHQGKPGGYIQWMEGDIEEYAPIQNTSQAPSDSLTLLGESAFSYLHSMGKVPRDCRRLIQIFKSIGLVDCTQDLFSSDRDAALRGEFSDVHARTLLGVMEKAGLQMWNDWNLEKVRELERKVFAELETGMVYTRYNYRVVVGRAPV